MRTCMANQRERGIRVNRADKLSLSHSANLSLVFFFFVFFFSLYFYFFALQLLLLALLMAYDSNSNSNLALCIVFARVVQMKMSAFCQTKISLYSLIVAYSQLKRSEQNALKNSSGQPVLDTQIWQICNYHCCLFINLFLFYAIHLIQARVRKVYKCIIKLANCSRRRRCW